MMEVHEDRPLATFAILTYNQERFIREAIEGALAQDYSPLEIIISDDCSSDKTLDVIYDTVRGYRGPHLVRVNSNYVNLGISRHVNLIFQMASCELIIAAAGDDISFPYRARYLLDAFKNSKNAQLIHSSVMSIDDHGRECGIIAPPVTHSMSDLKSLATCLPLYIGATALWTKSLYRKCGPITYINAYEDQVLGYRAALSDSLIYIDIPLVKYRINNGVSISWRKKLPITHIHTRIRKRKLHIMTTIDVYRQRLDDTIVLRASDEGLREEISNAMSCMQMRLFFYEKPQRIFLGIFSKHAYCALKAFSRETKYMLGNIG